AMGNDVIELSPVTVYIVEVRLDKSDVAKAERRYRFLALCNGPSGQIQADERTFRERPGHRHQIRCVTAANFQYAATGRRGWCQAAKGADHCQAVWMRLRMGEAWIQDRVVTG